MEREKQELRDYLEKDNKAMRDRMSQEEAERQRKEKEMAVRMQNISFNKTEKTFSLKRLRNSANYSFLTTHKRSLE